MKKCGKCKKVKAVNLFNWRNKLKGTLQSRCISCGKDCTDHDLAADWYMCDSCLDQSWRQYEEICVTTT